MNIKPISLLVGASCAPGDRDAVTDRVRGRSLPKLEDDGSRNNCNLSSLPNHALNPCPSGQIMGQICPSQISSVSFGFIRQNVGFDSRPPAANHDFRRVRRSKSSKIACPPPGQITVIARTCTVAEQTHVKSRTGLPPERCCISASQRWWPSLLHRPASPRDCLLPHSYKRATDFFKCQTALW